ncbi:predicted protein [Streptomyces iranensis]|uniref:Uncharacterized protein n=2 Tax=Streptomyces iranensis TaxID=576784 RepID=A0A060ZDL6_9ACTN|nr:predicted protein [Streptomyces iranensis]
MFRGVAFTGDEPPCYLADDDHICRNCTVYAACMMQVRRLGRPAGRLIRDPIARAADQPNLRIRFRFSGIRAFLTAL